MSKTNINLAATQVKDAQVQEAFKDQDRVNDQVVNRFEMTDENVQNVFNSLVDVARSLELVIEVLLGINVPDIATGINVNFGSLAGDISALKTKLNETIGQGNTEATDLTGHTGVINNLRDDMEDVGIVLNYLFGDVSGINDSVASITPSTSGATDDLSSLADSVSTDKISISNLVKDGAKLRQGAETLVNDIANMKTSVQQLVADVAANTSAVNAIKTELGIDITDTGNIKTATNSLRSEVSKITDDVEELYSVTSHDRNEILDYFAYFLAMLGERGWLNASWASSSSTGSGNFEWSDGTYAARSFRIIGIGGGAGALPPGVTVGDAILLEQASSSPWDIGDIVRNNAFLKVTTNPNYALTFDGNTPHYHTNNVDYYAITYVSDVAGYSDRLYVGVNFGFKEDGSRFAIGNVNNYIQESNSLTWGWCQVLRIDDVDFAPYRELLYSGGNYIQPGGSFNNNAARTYIRNTGEYRASTTLGNAADNTTNWTLAIENELHKDAAYKLNGVRRIISKAFYGTTATGRSSRSTSTGVPVGTSYGQTSNSSNLPGTVSQTASNSNLPSTVTQTSSTPTTSATTPNAEAFYSAEFSRGTVTVNYNTNEITFSGQEGYISVGDMVLFKSAGTLPSGIKYGNPYYVSVITNSTGPVVLCTVTEPGASVPIVLNFTDNGSGAHSAYEMTLPSISTSTPVGAVFRGNVTTISSDYIQIATVDGGQASIVDGDRVFFRTTNTSDAAPSGLSKNTIYYVRDRAIWNNGVRFRLATTKTGNNIGFSSTINGTLQCYEGAPKQNSGQLSTGVTTKTDSSGSIRGSDATNDATSVTNATIQDQATSAGVSTTTSVEVTEADVAPAKKEALKALQNLTKKTT